MAVLTTISTIVTLLATLRIMPGTMRRIYGSTGDGEIDAGAEDVARSSPPTRRWRRVPAWR